MPYEIYRGARIPAGPTTIKTRYRDVDFEQLLEDCFAKSTRPGTIIFKPFKDKWNELRGSSVVIELPPWYDPVGCGGPWYGVVGNDTFGVCPHMVEIGD